MNVENCSNCGGVIGKLERAYVFHENVVCQHCYQKLTDTEDKQVQTAIKKPIEVKAETVPPQTETREQKLPYQAQEEQVTQIRLTRRCNKRSRAFLWALFVWTVLMFVVLVIMLQPQTKEELIKQDINPYNPHEVAAYRAPGVCCPCGLWFIVAVPLGICAIATWGKG
jgi:hypothetical protein